MAFLKANWVVLFALAGILTLNTGCKVHETGDKNTGSHETSLIVYVTNNAPEVEQSAKEYGLKVRTIAEDSAASELVESLLNSPSGKYFAVVNPAFKRFIGGRALPDHVDKAQFDQMFQQMKLINNAGVSQSGRLSAESGKVKLAVFSDYQCPFCKMMDTYLRQIRPQYAGKVDIEMINFPLPMHDHAFAAAEAAECARVQGKFEPYSEALFDHQKDLSEGLYVQLARNFGLNSKQFSQCLTLHQTRTTVRQDQFFGSYLGLQGTPTLVLNGEVLQLAGPEQLQQKLQEAIAKANGQPVNSASTQPTPPAPSVENSGNATP